MATTICPACKLPLEIPAAMAGQQVACPRCRATFSSPIPQMAPLPAPAAPPTSYVAQDKLPTADSPAGSSAVREQPTTLLDIFDFTFKRYVTPLIVKITWVLTLFFTAIWLLLILTVLIIDLMPDSSPSMQQRPMLISFLDILGKVDRDWWRGLIRMIVLATQLTTTLLFVLWMRVLLESVIVIFNMAASLRSIDRKTKAA